MAKFKKVERGLKLEFEKLTFYLDVTNPETGKKLQKFGSDAQNEVFWDGLTYEEQRQQFIDLFNSLLGEKAYTKIRDAVYEGKELVLTELVDVGFYILQEVNEYNKNLNNSMNDIVSYAKTI